MAKEKKTNSQKNRQKSVIGLLVDSKSVVITQVKGTREEFVVEKAIFEYLPKGIIENGEILNIEKLARFIQNIFKNNSFSKDDIAFGIKNQNTLMRTAPFLKVAEEKMHNAVLFNAQKVLPVPINELSLDCVLCDEFIEDGKTMVNALIVGCKKIYINNIIEVVDAMGRYLCHIDSATLCAVRAVTQSYAEEDKVIMIAYIDFDTISITIIRNEDILMTRNIDIDEKCYEDYQENGSSDSNQAKINVNELSSQINQELLISLNFFENRYGLIINEICIVGENDKIEDIVEEISTYHSDYKVMLANCYRQQLQNKQQQFTVAVSLAQSQLEE